MSDQEKYSLIVVKYPSPEMGEAAFSLIHDLAKDKKVKLKDAVVITKNEDGKIKLHQTKDDSAKKGFLKGGLIGVLFAVLFGGAGWVLAGVVSGTAIGMFDRGIKNKLLKGLGEGMTTEESAVAVLIEEANWASIQERFEAQNLTGERIIFELVDEHMAEVEALANDPEKAESIPEEMELVEEPETADEVETDKVENSTEAEETT